MAKKKRRKLSKAEARAEAQRQKRQRQITYGVAAVVAAAVVIVVILIVISGGGNGGLDENAELVEPEPLRDDVETGLTENGYPYRGAADAPVTVEEFSDYNCPHCRDFNESTARLVDDQLVSTGDVKYVVPPFALWPESTPIAEAAVCATEQDGFWDFHHLVFANQDLFSLQQPPSRSLLRRFAEASGLDVEAFEACLDEGRRDEVVAATEDAKLKLGVDSTPSFFVNGERIQLYAGEAYIDTLRNAVQAAMSGGVSEGD